MLDGLSDDDLLRRAVQNAGLGGRQNLPRWSYVKEVFALGSNNSGALCQRFGLDPHEQIGGCPKCGDDLGTYDGDVFCLRCDGGE